VIVVAALCTAWALPARAHDPGLSSLTLRRASEQVEFRAIVNHADLPEQRRASSAHCNAADVLHVSWDDRPVRVEAACTRYDADHTAFDGHFSLPAQNGLLAVHFGLFDELPRGHRSFARLLDAQGTPSAQLLMTRGGAPLRSHVTAPAPWQFLALGFEHILTGFDHLLFLAVLLLGVESLRRMTLLVSSFTLAHSLSLALAAFGCISLPARVVEPLIALSIVVVAGRNFASRTRRSECLAVTFGFGLVHGLGFATALRELGVGGSSLTVLSPLLQFNLGVELGQLGIGALALPCCAALRRSRWPTAGVRTLSAAAAMLGSVWFVQRLLVPS
jgi:hydrogenase/urease accessory protein HupE